jgi:putative ABC transport system permease protein
MRPSWHIARHALSGRRTRTILLVIAVGLASALVAAVSTGMKTVQATVEYRISRSIGDVDARIVHRYGSPFEGEIAAEVRSWPGVRDAAARTEGALTLARTDDRRDEDGRRLRITAQARGVDATRQAAFDQYDLVEGRMPATTREILLDPLTAQRLDVGLGDTVRVERFGPAIELEVVGIRDRPILGALQKPSVIVDGTVIEEATGRAGKASLISILLEEGLDVPAWVESNKDRIELPLLLEAAERARAGYDRQVRASQVGFRVGTIVGFLACAFIVAIGMTTAIGEQVRQLAMLRCVGASRMQLAGSQAMVGLLIGGVGGLIGTPAGIGLAAVVRWWYADLLPGGLAVPIEGVISALSGAIGAGLLGAAWPAWRAASTSPLEALANRARPIPASAPWWFAAVGGGFAAVQVLLLLIPDPDVRFLVYAFVGLPAVHIGYFLLAVPVLAICARVLGRPFAMLFRLPRTLLTGNLLTGTVRLGLTSGALMVGLSVLVSTWSNGLALVEDFRERVRFADGFVMKTGGLGEEEQALIRGLPSVASASPVGYLPLRVAEHDRLGTGDLAPPNVVCVGFVPDEFLSFNRVDWIQGDAATAIPRLKDGDAVLVAKEFLLARGLGVGDTISLGAEGDEHEFEIVGVVGAAGLDMATGVFGIRSVYLEHAVSCVFMNFDTVAERFGTREAFIMQIALDVPTDAAAASAAEAALAETVRERIPGAIFASGREIKALVEEIGGKVLTVTASIASAALLLACLGVGNVVAAGITARGFEFGVLRAVGGSAGTAPRLVLAEVAVTGIAAVITGTALGVHLAWIGVLMYGDLAGIDLALRIPVVATTVGAAVVIASALIASIPASWSLRRQPPRALLATGRAG